MYKTVLTTPALNDLAETTRYIADSLKNRKAAHDFLNELEKQVELLEENPNAFPHVRDSFLAGQGIRFLPIKNYVAFYRVREKQKEVSIIRILFAKSNWQDMLRK